MVIGTERVLHKRLGTSQLMRRFLLLSRYVCVRAHVREYVRDAILCFHC